MDKLQGSNLTSPCLVETLLRHTLHREISNIKEIDPNKNLSLIHNQADNFEIQLKEIDSEIQKFESKNNSLLDNHLEFSATDSVGERIA